MKCGNILNHEFLEAETLEATDQKLETYFRMENLQPDSAYYLIVTAVNEHGEGYKTEVATMVRTLPIEAQKTRDLYVWGSNTNSEIGLTEALVADNKAVFTKTAKIAYLS